MQKKNICLNKSLETILGPLVCPVITQSEALSVCFICLYPSRGPDGTADADAGPAAASVPTTVSTEPLTAATERQPPAAVPGSTHSHTAKL